jgi:hypothetical protein
MDRFDFFIFFEFGSYDKYILLEEVHKNWVIFLGFKDAEIFKEFFNDRLFNKELFDNNLPIILFFIQDNCLRGFFI